jgi:ABC-type branched-subunit amino acid transport system ATPase component
LFHVLSGDLKPDSGNIIFNGEEIAGLSPWKIARRKIGKLYQDVRVFKDMTLCENVQVALLSETEYRLTSAFSPLNDREKKHKEEALYWLEYVGLADLANDQAGKLSYGQQKLLSIARLIAHKSRLLLLDEPTAALSPVMIQKMIELIRKLVLEQNCSVALIEHNMNVVKELAHYTYFMHEGSIFCHGTQESVLENSEVRELYMGLTGSAKR